jgi:hypothetical protein
MRGFGGIWRGLNERLAEFGRGLNERVSGVWRGLKRG